MLKQILSVSDVKKLKIGDRLSDHPDVSLGKTYIVGNVAYGLVYAIYHSGLVELKVFKTNEVPQTEWWVYIQDYIEHKPG